MQLINNPFFAIHQVFALLICLELFRACYTWWGHFGPEKKKNLAPPPQIPQFSEEFQKPQPLQLVQKVLQYASNLYGSTPPICIAGAFLASKLRRKGNPAIHLPLVLQYASHLYGSTPPICTAVLLRKYWGLGFPERL